MSLLWGTDADGDASTTATQTRSKSVLVLGEALGDTTPLFDVANALESVIFVRHQQGGSERRGASTSTTTSTMTLGNDYRGKVRVLAANLRRNEALAEAVRMGRVSCEALVEMTADELATDETRRRREAMETRATERRTRKHFDDGTNSEAYCCPGCKSRECKYVMLSGNRDIRKAEIWGGGSGEAENLVLVQCQHCQHEWRETVL
jgi:DNA-directed RNA polymerase subunit M/transcription elongation factor TFIIS